MRDNLVEKLYRKTTVDRINSKNKLLGIRYNYDVNYILLSHLIISILVLFISFLIKKDILFSLVIFLIYFFLAEYIFFDLRLKKRGKLLERESIFYFQILALTLESGNNLKNAIELTSKNINNTLSDEFKKVIQDVNMGKSLTEALNDLKLRVPSDTVNNIILNLLESNIYGNNMIESLNNQLDYLSDKILLETKAKINKMPVKISVVSALIFVPLILLIILSPIVINLINS